jgi:hypothetical protein
MSEYLFSTDHWAELGVVVPAPAVPLDTISADGSNVMEMTNEMISRLRSFCLMIELGTLIVVKGKSAGINRGRGRSRSAVVVVEVGAGGCGVADSDEEDVAGEDGTGGGASTGGGGLVDDSSTGDDFSIPPGNADKASGGESTSRTVGDGDLTLSIG